MCLPDRPAAGPGLPHVGTSWHDCAQVAGRAADLGAGRATGRSGYLGGTRGAEPPEGHLTKYQFSGLMLSVGLSGVTPLRLSATSLSW
jgi:hypothetical protein